MNDRYSGQHRRSHRRIQPYAWLGAGAVTLGVGAALASGSAIAHAETGAGAGNGKSGPESSQTESANRDSVTTPKKATGHSARATVSSSGGKTTARGSSAHQDAVETPAPAAAVVADAPAALATAPAEKVTRSATARSARVRAVAANVDSAGATNAAPTTAAGVTTPAPAADPSYSMQSWLPSDPIVPYVKVNLAKQQIATAQTQLNQQTWGSGNVFAGLAALVPQALLSQAASSVNSWETALPSAQAFYKDTANIPIVHQIAQVNLVGAMLLPSVATASLSGASLLLPVVGLFGASVTSVSNTVKAAEQNSRVYAVVPVTMKATTEPVVYVSVNGGPSVPVLVDTGSSGLVLTADSVGQTNLGPQTNCATNTFTCQSGYSGGLTYTYNTYNTTVDFGNGIVTEPTAVNVVTSADAQEFKDYLKPAGVVGVLGIGANSVGPGPAIPTTSLPGELSDGVLIYQNLFLGLGGVMVFGPNPLPVRVSVPGAPAADLNVQIGNGQLTPVQTIIDSGGVYGTIPASVVGQSSGNVPAGTKISYYTADGQTLLYSYTTTAGNGPMVIPSGPMNTGYMPFNLGPVYINYSAPDRIGSTDFAYA